MKTITIINLLETIMTLATEIPALFAKAQLLKGELQVFVDEGRDPTDAEWDEVNVKSQSMLATLDQRAKDAQDHLDRLG